MIDWNETTQYEAQHQIASMLFTLEQARTYRIAAPASYAQAMAKLNAHSVTAYEEYHEWLSVMIEAQQQQRDLDAQVRKVRDLKRITTQGETSAHR
jgi:hypothetical protein